MTESEVRARLKARVDAAGTAKAWAEAHQISDVYVTDVLNRGKAPGPKLLAALGVEKVTAYRELVTSPEG